MQSSNIFNSKYLDKYFNVVNNLFSPEISHSSLKLPSDAHGYHEHFFECKRRPLTDELC